MRKFRCTVCGYVHEGENPPACCPTCRMPALKFVEVNAEKRVFAAEHVVGVAAGVDPEVLIGLRANFESECADAGVYLAMSRAAEREGYPEIADVLRRFAFEEAEHAARFAELIGDSVSPSTKRNLETRATAEFSATEGKAALAKLAKDQDLDAIHDLVHEIARDEARHGKAVEGLLRRYF